MKYKCRGYAGDRLPTTPSYTMTNRTKSYKGKEPHALAVCVCVGGCNLRPPCSSRPQSKPSPVNKKKKLGVVPRGDGKGSLKGGKPPTNPYNIPVFRYYLKTQGNAGHDLGAMVRGNQ